MVWSVDGFVEYSPAIVNIASLVYDFMKALRQEISGVIDFSRHWQFAIVL